MVFRLFVAISILLLNVVGGQNAPGPFPISGALFGQIDQPATFDYVVVGGGPAGLTMAARLAQNFTVAVIEAGGMPETEGAAAGTIPAQFALYLGKNPVFTNPLTDWGQQTTPQPGFNGASVLYNAGKTLGGGSSKGAMFYQRATVGACENWAKEVGDESYSFEQLLPFFQRTVAFTPPNDQLRFPNATVQFNQSSFSKDGGPVQVTFPNYANPGATWFKLALDELGFTEINGLQDGEILGYAWQPFTIDPVKQERSSGWTAFAPTLLASFPNLVIYTHTMGKRILFDSNNTAVGVEVETGTSQNAVTFTLNATREVILSGGSFRSPQMLMVSGIGPSNVLQENGIKILADRPGVGQNMWDHIWFGVSYQMDLLSHTWLLIPDVAQAAGAQYLVSRTGILTNTGGDIIAFEKLPADSISSETRAALDQTFGADFPDVEYISSDAFVGTFDDLLFANPNISNYTAISVAIAAPFSRGNVSISSNDTNDYPLVNPGWLTDPRDREVAVAGFKRARDMFRTNAIKPILTSPELYPGAQVADDDDDAILKNIMVSSAPEFHAAGSNRMGKYDDPMAVVDSKARVFGVHGLRVVDASVLPVLPGHIQSAVYALAEKIAADILDAAA